MSYFRFSKMLTLFFCRGIEIDLILEWGSNWLDFSAGVEVNFIIVWEIEFDFV